MTIQLHNISQSARMKLFVLLTLCGAVLLAHAAGPYDNCLYYQDVAAGQILYVFSPNYPNSYPKGINCLWEAVAPSNSHFILQCFDFSIPAVSEICTLFRLKSFFKKGDSGGPLKCRQYSVHTHSFITRKRDSQ